MKVASQLAVLLSLGAFPLLASARGEEQAYLETYPKGPNVPVPVAVVIPHDPAAIVGDRVKLEFTVEATGKTSKISVLSSTDAALARAAVDAVKQWQFAPVRRNGVPVATRVVLPVNIVAPETQASYASQ